MRTLHTLAVAAAIVAAAIVLPAAAQNAPAAKQTALKISKETTRITAPLDEQGYVDYLRAINQLASRGVTPENNFEVVVRRVLGADGIPEPLREEHFRRLGIATPSAEGLLQNFVAFVLEQRPDSDAARVTDEYGKVTSAPWKAADHPLAEKWLRKFQPQLDTIAAGARRSHYYAPYLASPDDEDEQAYPALLAMLLPSIQEHRELARCLSVRAYYRLGRGDVDAAAEDVLAIGRLSRLSMQGVTLIEMLVGIAIDGMAFEAAAELIQSPQWNAEHARKFEQELRKLPPMPTMAGKIDIGERYMALDVVQMLAREGSGPRGLIKSMKLIEALSSADPADLPLTSYVARQENGGEGPIDWNVAARTLNQWYDRLVTAAAEKDLDKRRRLQEEIDADLKKLAARAKGRTGILGLAAAVVAPREKLGELMGDILTSLLLPAVQAVTTAESDAIARHRVLLAALRAQQHRAQRRQFPRQLAELRLPAEETRDPHSGRQLAFRADDDGLLLYSVGRNGQDDQGRGHDDREGRPAAEWDDIAVRLRPE